MSAFSFDLLVDYIVNILPRLDCHALSLGLFVTCVGVVLAYAAVILLSKRAREVSSVWCLFLFQTVFLADLCLCLLAAESGAVYASAVRTFSYCFFKLVLLTVLYALLLALKCACRAGDAAQKREEDAAFKQPKAKDDGDDASLLDGEKKQLALKILDKLINPEAPAAVDVNIGYLREVLERIMQKELLAEERERFKELEFMLKTYPKCDEKTVRRLNGLLELLVKKATEYGVSA